MRELPKHFMSGKPADRVCTDQKTRRALTVSRIWCKFVHSCCWYTLQRMWPAILQMRNPAIIVVTQYVLYMHCQVRVPCMYNNYYVLLFGFGMIEATQAVQKHICVCLCVCTMLYCNICPILDWQLQTVSVLVYSSWLSWYRQHFMPCI